MPKKFKKRIALKKTVKKRVAPKLNTKALHQLEQARKIRESIGTVRFKVRDLVKEIRK